MNLASCDCQSGDRLRQPDHAEPHRMAEGAPDALNSCTRRHVMGRGPHAAVLSFGYV
jgi:hypothetical protein